MDIYECGKFVAAWVNSGLCWALEEVWRQTRLEALRSYKATNKDDLHLGSTSVDDMFHLHMDKLAPD